MSEILKSFDIFEFLQSVLSHSPIETRKPKSAISKHSELPVQSLLSDCQHSDSKSIQKVHKLHKNEVFEIFRPFWSHSEVFSK